MNFKNWLLKEDIFGFEKRIKPQSKLVVGENPIIPIDAEIVTEAMLKMNLNEKIPFSDYPDQVQWGKEPGSIQMVISPLGSFKSIVRKLQIDLEGNQVWACKRIIPYKNILNANRQFDENLAEEIFEEIAQIDKEEIESPSKDYKNLERLVIKISHVCQRKESMPKLFIYRGIKEIKKHENYLVFFDCRGHGVETPGSSRLEQFIIDMSFNTKTGMIRSFGHDVQSPTKGHVWYPQPSEWDEYFSPSQTETEISECIGAALSTY